MAKGTLWNEEIYDALCDDEMLAALPGRLAEVFGARSCVIHWHHADGGAQVLSHSDHFSSEQMRLYAEEFAPSDPWARASAHLGIANKAQNLDEIVPAREYERSLFFNEYVRGIGDDTFHCVGVRIVNDWGAGMVAIQRGRTQGAFSGDAVKVLDRKLPHLRRMLAIRGQLARAEQRSGESRAAMNALGDAFLIVTADARITFLNEAAQVLLKGENGLAVHEQRLTARSHSATRNLLGAIAQAVDASAARAGAVRIPRTEGGQLDLTVVPIADGQGDRRAMISIRHPGPADPSLRDRLRSLYGLSPAEAETAIRLAAGLSPVEIAGDRKIAVSTVRIQVKAVAAKMGCNRQLEIAAAVNGLVKLWARSDLAASDPG